MLRRSILRLWWVVTAGTVLMTAVVIAPAPAGAVANPVRVHVRNGTAEKIFIGSTQDLGDKHYLSPGDSWSNVGDADTTNKTINVVGFIQQKNFKACGELKIVNPALGFPYVELFKRAEDSSKGVSDTFRFAVDESHTFDYHGAKLLVKRVSDHEQKHVDHVFSTHYKVFNVTVESCPDR